MTTLHYAISVVLLFTLPTAANASFGELCGDIIRVASGYARIPTDLLEKFWANATVPREVKSFDHELFKDASRRYLEQFKKGEFDKITLYGAFELEAGFLDAVIEWKALAHFEIDNALIKGSSTKKKAFYNVIRKISDSKGHTVGELNRMMGELYSITYSDALITEKWANQGLEVAAKYHFIKIAEERAAARGFIRAFRDLGLIRKPSHYSRFMDLLYDKRVVTAIDVGLNYGLVTRSPVVFAKAPGQKFSSWIKFPISVKRKILLGDYEGAWMEMAPILKTKVKFDVAYQGLRYGVNSVMPYVTAASIGYLVYDRWLEWKIENPDRDSDIPPPNVWPKPKSSQLRALLRDAPNSNEIDFDSAYKAFGI